MRERLMKEHEVRVLRVDKEAQFARETGKRELDRYEEEVREVAERKKLEVEREFQGEFDKEKGEYLKEQNERSETY